MPEIIVKYEDKVIERIVTEKRRLSIGRTNENDIVLENRGVSRKHAIIEFNDKAAVVIDNESLNGTFVNNRKITEEVLRDEDIITIGKYSLIYHTQAEAGQGGTEMDGTMVLNTKKHRDLLQNDRMEREIVAKYGGSVLLGEENADFSEFKIDRDVITFGKAKFVNVVCRGFWLSGIQAKLVREEGGYAIHNMGKKGKTLVNGEVTEYRLIRNGDLITVGKSTFKMVERKG
jgi:pSer/pThr/pTyr-binding forkhead associated (FHA) protein